MNGAGLNHTVVQRSASKLLGFATIAAGFVAGGVWMINSDEKVLRGVSSVTWGWFVAVFFGLGMVVFCYRLIFGHQKPLELSPQGFWDKRALKQRVPWSAVSRISVWSHRGSSVLRVQFTDEAFLRNHLTPHGKIIRWLNKPFGLDGIYIESTDLDISFPELRTLFQKYLSEYGPTVTDDIK